MHYFIGKNVLDVVEILKSNGDKFQIVDYNDRKMTNFDITLVIKAEKDNDVTTLTCGNFLFHPIEKQNTI